MEDQPSQTIKIATPCGNIYITLTFDKNFRSQRIFLYSGKGATCLNTQLRVISHLITRAFNHDVGLIEIAQDLKDHYCGIEHSTRFKSCSDAIANWLIEIHKGYITGEILKVAGN